MEELHGGEHLEKPRVELLGLRRALRASTEDSFLTAHIQVATILWKGTTALARCSWSHFTTQS